MSCVRVWVKILVHQITADLGLIKIVKSEFLVCPSVGSKRPLLTERIELLAVHELATRAACKVFECRFQLTVKTQMQ
jgi:hypothetical protein